MTWFSIAAPLLLFSCNSHFIRLTSDNFYGLTAQLHSEYMLFGLHWIKPCVPGKTTDLWKRRKKGPNAQISHLPLIIL